MPKRNVAIILAAGEGQRASFSQPKQLVKLAGKPIISHTVTTFQQHPLIDEIAIITNASCVEQVENLILKEKFNKVKKVLLGGRTRDESSLAAIRAYELEPDSDNIQLIFHDAVRPLVTNKIITDIIEALNHYKAADVVINSADTVIVADLDTNTIRDIPERRLIKLGQTPQGFHLQTIKTAYERALLDPQFKTTDDCGVVLKYLPQEPIYLVDGATTNLKLTYENDLLVIDKFMQVNTARRISLSADHLSALRDQTIVIIGGTSGIGASMSRLSAGYGAKVYSAGKSTGVDVSNYDSVTEFLENAYRETGRIDSIVNTAAILVHQPLEFMPAEDVASSVGTNFLGAVNVARAGIKYLASSHGHLMLFASSSYTYGRAFYSLYSATKAATVNLMQALAEEWSELGVKVNCVNPERTHTPMRTRAFGKESLDTLLDPDEVARKALGILLTDTTGFVYDILKN